MERTAFIGMVGVILIVSGCGPDALGPEPMDDPGVLAELDHSDRRFMLINATGNPYTCALTVSGVPYCWGLGRSTAPTVLTGAPAFIHLSGGHGHTCGIDAEGNAFCWGQNDFGALGDGTTTVRLQPGKVSGGRRFTSISAGFGHTCGLEADGDLYCWGGNANGQLGDGTTLDRHGPVVVTGGHRFVSIAAGWSHTCGLEADGAAYCWGMGRNGQLGNGGTDDRSVPTPLSGGITFASITAGASHTCGTDTDGDAYCWGSNYWGALGTSGDPHAPAPVLGAFTFASISAGSLHTCALDLDGHAYCWGDVESGKLGTTTHERGPNPVAGGLVFASISAGGVHTCAIDMKGDAYCWGNNVFGQIGDGTMVNRAVPTRVVDPSGAPDAVPTAVVTDLHPWIVTDTLVLVRWTQVDDGTGAPADYRLKYSEGALADWKSATVGCDRWVRGEAVGLFIQCEIEGLKPSTEYEFQLMSFRMEDGRWAGARYSNTARATTLQLRADPVTDLAARDVTDAGMTLAWTQVDDGTGEPARYRLRYGPEPMVPWRSGAIGCDVAGDAIGAEIECTIDGLEPGVTYRALLMSFRLEDGVWVGARYSNYILVTTVEGGG